MHLLETGIWCGFSLTVIYHLIVQWAAVAQIHSMFADDIFQMCAVGYSLYLFHLLMAILNNCLL